MGSTGPTHASLECRLDSAHDLAALLAVLQLKDKEQKDQRVYCEASSRGLKFAAQSSAKDVAVVAWMFSDAFKQYSFSGQQDIHLKIPVAPLLNCLHIFSERSALILRYPSGPSDELRFLLEEDDATTECCLRTLVLDDAPEPMNSFFAPGDSLSMFRPVQPEVWHHALSEFQDLDSPDVAMQIALRTGGTAVGSVVLHAQTLTSDAEVELPQGSLAELNVPQEISRRGEVAYRYLLSSVLGCCMRAARDATAVKVRFNSQGVMSNQFILRGRGQRDFFCEALVSPLAEVGRIPQMDAEGDDGMCVSASAGGYPQGGMY